MGATLHPVVIQGIDSLLSLLAVSFLVLLNTLDVIKIMTKALADDSPTRVSRK